MSPRAGSRGPVVLIFPPGGFFLRASPGLMDDAASVARASGFEPTIVDYPTGDLPGAFEHSLEVAHETGATYAYGESAGGLLAARLTQMGAFRRAVVNAPISNLFTWPLPAVPKAGYTDGWGMSRDELAHLSPAYHLTEAPIDILHSVGDDVVPLLDSLLWERRDRLVTLHLVDDPHIHGPAYPFKLGLAFALMRDGPLKRRLRLIKRRATGRLHGRN